MTEPEITWRVIHTPVQTDLWDMCFVNAVEDWVVGDKGTILHTADGGDTWMSQSCPIDAPLVGIRFTSPNLGWIMAKDATILYTNDIYTVCLYG